MVLLFLIVQYFSIFFALPLYVHFPISNPKIRTMINNSNCDKNSIPFVPRTIPLSEQFIISEGTQEKVQQVITNMPSGKAPGPEKISLKVIKDCLPVILKPLTCTINASFTSQVYPSLCKKQRPYLFPKLATTIINKLKTTDQYRCYLYYLTFARK